MSRTEVWTLPSAQEREQQLRQLHVLVDSTTNGVITFGFFQHIADREAAVQWLKDELETPVREVRLSKETKNPLALLRKIPDEPRCCVQIYDLEDALPEVTGYINYGREAYLEVPHALVFWVGPHGLQQVARKAPDFWAWRSGVFDVRINPDREVSVTDQFLDTLRTPVLVEPPERYTGPEDLERKAHYYEQLIKDQMGRHPAGDSYCARLRSRRMGVLFHLRRFSDMVLEAETLKRWAQATGEPDFEAESLLMLGKVGQIENDLTTTAHHFEKAESISAELSDPITHLRAVLNLGALALEQSNARKADKCVRTALRGFKEARDSFHISEANHLLGIVAEQEGDLDEANHFYAEALEQKQELDDQRGIARALEHIAQVAIRRREMNAAERLLFDALKAREDAGDTYGTVRTRMFLSLLSYQRDDLISAAAHLSDALLLAQEDEDHRTADQIKTEMSRLVQTSRRESREQLKSMWLDRGHPPIWDNE